MNQFLAFLHLLSLLGLIAAINLCSIQRKLPACSVRCLLESARGNGCGVGDFACQCGTLPSTIKTVAPCLVRAGCELEDIAVTAKVVVEFCQNNVPENATDCCDRRSQRLVPMSHRQWKEKELRMSLDYPR
ncbi:hypothetical protein RJ55_03623 [Drechmeria coniospora]|nr:hypothetical protein RJ55_03623 [Drechmeria coniospora]